MEADFIDTMVLLKITSTEKVKLTALQKLNKNIMKVLIVVTINISQTF